MQKKRKRGRPRKEDKVPSSISSPPIKRRPGRPRKPPAQASEGESTEQRKPPLGLPPSPTKSNEIDIRSDASLTDSPVKPAPKRPRGRPPKHKSEDTTTEAGVMGKLQVSFSESESECSDPMDVHRSAIEALTDIVAPPISKPQHQAQTITSTLLIDKFEESFDEDSDN